ncbi:MAG: aldo/keto reductase [Leptospirales bacterium]|nr:aldo/keto reductase [Leptospirales bacterium]
MTEKKITRRQAIKYAGVGAAGLVGAYYGLSRSGLIAFLDDDAKKTHFPQVTKRENYVNGDIIPLLSFGCMRFPIKGRNRADIDEELTSKMLDYAYRRGINFFDTAYVYHSGNSETFMGKYLKKYPRKDFFISTKMPGWLVKTSEDPKRLFQEQLDKLQTDYVDYYLLHSLRHDNPMANFKHVYEELGTLEYLKREKEAGRIRQLGFSFHGDMPLMKYLLSKYKWDFCMIQLNYFDWDLDEGGGSDNEDVIINKKFYPAAQYYRMLEEKKIPALVMEPLRGGQLAVLNPDAVKILKESDPSQTPVSWALRYAAGFPNVLSLLSGMSTMKHVVENTDIMTDFEPLEEKDYAVLNKALIAFKEKLGILCTQCMYCMPCPYGVNITEIFRVYNQCAGTIGVPVDPISQNYLKQKKTFLVSYNNAVRKDERADHCTGCGKCVDICPQKLEVPAFMAQIEKIVNTAKGKA